MDNSSTRNNSAKQQVPFEEAILKAKVAQICDHVGYNAITQDSSNILVDLYRRTVHHLARHCKEAANNNRRIEPTLIDLEQAYDFVGISIPELQEHIDTVKIPLNVEITQEEPDKPPNRIQRNLLVDDLLEAEKTNQDGDQDGENCIEDDDKPPIPLLKDAYEELSSKFATPSSPVKADKKIRPGRILLLANKLKIAPPLPAEPLASTSKPSKPSKLNKPGKPTPTKGVSPRGKAIKNKRAGGRPPGGGPSKKKLKTAITPLDPSFAEPPSFFPLLEGKLEDEPDIVPPIMSSISTPTPPPPVVSVKKEKIKKKEKSGRKKGIKIEENAVRTPTPVVDNQPEEPKKKKKKLTIKVEPAEEPIARIPTPVVTPVPAPAPIATPSPALTPTFTSAKQTKGKKKKNKSGNQFSIVTETVTATDDKEWLCPGCGGPDDGDLMVECDTCKEWYHLNCTDLKKPPEDDENWECEICIQKARQALAAKRAQTTIETIIKTKTPDPVVSTPPPPQPQPPPPPPPAPQASGSQDDCCPECNLPDDGTMMIQCDDPFCARWFHGKCVNLLEEPKDDESWFCKACVEKQQSAFKRRRRAK